MSEYYRNLLAGLGDPTPSQEGPDLAGGGEVEGEYYRNLLMGALGPPQDRPEPDFYSSLGKTVAWNAGPGLIGIKPPEDVEDFQAKHPMLGLGAALVGMAAPYGLAAKFAPFVAARTPLLNRAVKFAVSDEAKAKPFVAGATKAAAEFAPFYMARIAAAAALGDEGAVMDVARSSAIETAMIGAAGGAITSIARGRPFTGVRREQEGRIWKQYPDYEINESPQRRIQMLNEIKRNNPNLEQTDEAIYQDIINTKNELFKRVIGEDPPPKVAFTQKLETGSAAKINPLFSNPKIQGVKVEKLPDPIEEVGDYQMAVRDLAPSSLPGEVEAHVRYPRRIKAETPEASEALWRKINGSFQHQVAFGRQTWMAKEADGVYVMAKQTAGHQGTPVPKGSIEKVTDSGETLYNAKIGGRDLGDYVTKEHAQVAINKELEKYKGTWQPSEWVIFKTTKPGLFAPRAQRFGELPVKGSFWNTEVARLDENLRGIPEARFLRTLLMESENPDLRGAMPGAASAMFKVLGPDTKKFLKESGKGLEFTKERLKEIFAPSLFQGSRDPEFNSLLNISRVMHARGAARAGQLFYGSEIPKEGTNLFQELLGANERVGGIEKLIDALDDVDLKNFQKIHISGASISEARAKYGASEKLVALLRKLQNVDRSYMGQMEKLQATTGNALITPIENHYMMSRSWFGDWRVPVFKKNVDGAFETQPVGIASGFSKKEALEEADALKTELEKLYSDKFGFLDSHAELVGRESDRSMAASINLTRKEARSFLKAREELLTRRAKEPFRGKTRREFLGFKENLDKKEIKGIIHANLLENERIIAENLISHEMSPLVERLARRDPELATQLAERIRMLAGEKSNFLAGFDKALDPWLAPIAGKNAASNIVRGFNKAMFSWTLAFGDLGFVGVNMLTPIISLLPEVAFTLSTPKENLAKYYSHALVWGRKGPINVRHLDPMRLVMHGLKSMAHPTKEEKDAFMWAMEHGVIAPRYAEEFLGQQSATVKNWREMLSGKQGIVEWLKALNNFLPAKSEEFARGASFMTGLKVGKDFFNLEGEQLWRWAAEVTARTNFLYSSGDRAKIITGTLGSFYGLFKNWGMHQAGNMMVYAGEAAARRNFAPLLWAMGSIGSIGGAGALPFYGVADSFSKLASNDSLTQNIYEGMGFAGAPTGASDLFVYGFPSLLGVALQGRVSPTGNQIARDVDQLFQSVTLERMGALGDAIGAEVQNWKDTGVHPLALERNRNLFYRALLPRSLYRALSFTEEGALQSLRTGNALTGPNTIPKRIQYVLGLTPLEFEKTQDLNAEMWNDQARQKEKVSNFGKAWAEASQRGDVEEMADLAKRSVYEGVQFDSMTRSADGYIRGLLEEQIQRQFDLYVASQKKKARGL